MGNYNEESITVHQGLDGVRAKPGMYIGTPDSSGMFQCAKEIIDNSIDECLAGHSTTVAVSFKDDYIYVYDNGRGIPVGIHPTSKISTLTTIFTSLHAGGKMETTDKNYEFSVGTHGVGSSVTNALSEELTVYTNRDNQWHTQQFKQGKVTSKVRKIKDTKLPKLHSKLKITKGTIVKFKLDKNCFHKGSKLTIDDIRQWFQISCYLHPKVVFCISTKDSYEEFYQPEGLVSFRESLLEKYKCEAFGDYFIFKNNQIDVLLQWSSYDNEAIHSYVNGSKTQDGGTHVNGLFKAITESFKDLKKTKDSFQPADLRNGLIAAINVKVASPQFDNQTKDKLITTEATSIVYNLIFKELELFFKKRKSFVKDLISRANIIREAQNQLKVSKKAAAKLKGTKNKSQLPIKLVSSTTKIPGKRELLIVEGGSAAGCVSGNTYVYVKGSKPKTFEEMVKGHKKGKKFKGIGYDLETNKFEEFNFFEPRITKEVDELIEVEMSDGTVVKCTIDHPWLLKSGEYVAAENLKPGDKLITYKP